MKRKQLDHKNLSGHISVDKYAVKLCSLSQCYVSLLYSFLNAMLARLYFYCRCCFCNIFDFCRNVGVSVGGVNIKTELLMVSLKYRRDRE